MLRLCDYKQSAKMMGKSVWIRTQKIFQLKGIRKYSSCNINFENQVTS